VGSHLETFPPAIAAKAKAASAQMEQMFQHAAKIGVPIAMGTDAGVEPHGLNAKEFSLMAKNGLPPAQVLMAGTAGGAELLGITEQTGTLSVGKSADIVALPGNPLTNIAATEHPLLVMKEGQIYVRSAGTPTH
jgi:imidazolonepropionase-like amidohydrolase